MTAATRRRVILGALCAAMLGGLPITGVQAGPLPWIEVTGFGTAANAADRDAARRRALADALLSAALAGGAQVKGHSAMAMGKVTSDLLIVRPVGQVLAHRVLAADFDGHIWRVRIAAQVGQPRPGLCSDRRRLILTAYPVQVHVSAMAPAWADALGRDLASELLDRAARHPVVAQVIRAARLPVADPSRAASDYVSLTRGRSDVPPGGHGLHLELHLGPEGRDLGLTLRMRLVGAGQALLEQSHTARVRLPGPSPLGRVAVLAQKDRQAMTADLARGASAGLDGFLQRAGCQPPQARLVLSGGRLTVPLGHVHGLSRASLGFTADGDASTEMLEVTHLSDRSATLAPLDPARPLSAFEGRAVRFLEMSGRLP